MIIHDWFARQRSIREDRARARGFDWAAGQLLRGAPVAELEAQIAFVDFTSFDQGIVDAIARWDRASIATSDQGEEACK